LRLPWSPGPPCAPSQITNKWRDEYSATWVFITIRQIKQIMTKKNVKLFAYYNIIYIYL
jgi:hypothetical protein